MKTVKLRIRNRHKPRTKRFNWTVRRLKETLARHWKKPVKISPAVINGMRGKVVPERFILKIDDKGDHIWVDRG